MILAILALLAQDAVKPAEAAKKALDFLVAQQKEDGSIPANKPPLTYVKTDRSVIDVLTSGFTGLALLAGGSTTSAGPYQKNLAGIRDYLRKSLEEILAVKPRRAGGGGGPIYSAAVGLLFFTHLYEADKSDASRKMCLDLVRYLSDCVGEEVNKSCWQKGKDPGTVWYVSGVTALANLTTVALTRAKASGFEVEPKILDFLRRYYRDILLKNGTFKYDQDNMFPNEPRQGRCIGALLALQSLGINVEQEYASSVEYMRANVGKANTHHTPSINLTMGAYSFGALGKKDWAKFVEANFEKLIARQQADGSLEKIAEYDKGLMMTPNDLAWGKTYATALFALILQIDTARVRFHIPEY